MNKAETTKAPRRRTRAAIGGAIGAAGETLKTAGWRVDHHYSHKFTFGGWKLEHCQAFSRDYKAGTVTTNVKVVIVPKVFFDHLVETAEEASDLDAVRRSKRGESGPRLPIAFVDRILAGESPWRVWREFRELTLDQLAERVAEHGAKITKGGLSHIETGRSQPSLALASAVAKALEVPLDNLAP